MSKVRKWYEGLGIRIPISFRHETQYEKLLEDEAVIDLLRLAYHAGAGVFQGPFKNFDQFLHYMQDKHSIKDKI